LRLESLLSKQSAQSIKNALTIQPKVIPADDPVSLASDPGPLTPDLFVAAAAVLEQQNRTAEAAQKYEQALAAAPDHRAAMIGLARLRHREGNLAGAVEVYHRALQAYPDDAVLLNDLGLCYARAGQTQDALAVLQRAVDLAPTSTLYRNNLAAVLVEANRGDEAVPLLAQTCGTAVAHYNVGYLLHKRGQNAIAVDHFAAALQANPSLAPARSMLQQLAPQVSELPTRNLQPSVSQPPDSPRGNVPGNPGESENSQQDAPPTWPTKPASFTAAVMTPEPVAGEQSETTNAGLPPAAESAEESGVDEAAAEFPIPRLLRLPMTARSTRKPGHLVPPAPRPVRPAFHAEFLPTIGSSPSP
jgi:tetratricopeptide (TPR) repeat protein